MSSKYSFNWYNWFKKSGEIDNKENDEKHFQTKHLEEEYPWGIKIQDKDIIRNLNRYNNSREKRTGIKKSKTSLKVRRHRKKKHSHHTQQTRRDVYANKPHKTELESSKQHRHYRSSKTINDRYKERNYVKDKQYNRDKHPEAGDIPHHQHHRKEKVSDHRRTQRKDIDGKYEKRRQLQNEGITQTKTRNLSYKGENKLTTTPRTKPVLEKEKRGYRDEVESRKLPRTRNSSFIEEGEEVIQNVIDLTSSSRDEIKNSAGRKILGTRDKNFHNHPLERKNCSKSSRTDSPEKKSEKLDKPATTPFSKVWPSDNSDEKIAKQNRQLSENSCTSNKSNQINEKRKQDMRRKPRIASSNCIDSKKKGFVKNNRTNLRTEDENGKRTLKRNNSRTNRSKDSRTSSNCYKKLEHVHKSSKCNDILCRNNSEDIVSRSIDDSIDLISILKEIKSMKDQLKSLSDEDDLNDNGSKEKNIENRRKLECIEEEIEIQNSTGGNLQSMVSLETVPCKSETSPILNNESLISSTLLPQPLTLEKNVLTQDSSCKVTPLLITPSMSEGQGLQQQELTENSCEIVETGLSDTKQFSITQSAKCLNFYEFGKHDFSQFLNKRMFCFKSYIPASERKNKKEVLMKKRLLSRLRTCNIPIKRKLDAISSSNLRKIKCSSSSKEDQETPAYDFTPFLKRNIPCTSFPQLSSSVNPFLPYSDISRCTSASLISREKVWSYTCSLDVERRAKSESSLKYLKKPYYSTSKVQVFENSTNEEVRKIIKKPMYGKKVNYKRLKNKQQKYKMKTKKAKQKQITDENEHQVNNVLKIENLSCHSDTIWKTISIEFNDTCLKSENQLTEGKLDIMLSEITEYLKAKAVQPNNLINIEDVSFETNAVEDLNTNTESSNHVDKKESFVKSDSCLEGFIIDDCTASEKSSQTSTKDTPFNTDTDIEHPFVDIAKAIELLHENNEENKKEIKKINETCKIKFSWLEKTIFDILTQPKKIPMDFSSIRNIEQHCYSITNFTFRKSLSNSKNFNYKCQQIEKFGMFSGSNSNTTELDKNYKTLEYHLVKSNYNAMEPAKSNKKSKMSHFAKNIRKVFREFVRRKKN